MKIIEIRPRRKSLCGILFDCELDVAEYGGDADPAGYLALDSELCELKRLRAGTELSDGELVQLIRESHIKRARSRAMWYLSRSSCSKKALIEKLARNFPDYAAEAAAERMEELGFIDDREYARRRLSRILEEKKVSLKLAKHLLTAEGIDKELADEAAEELEFDPKTVLIHLIERRYQDKLSGENRDKTVAALMRKGYSYSEIREALREFLCDMEYYED